jgi:transcriptional regulator with XRE-family HTH domain
MHLNSRERFPDPSVLDVAGTLTLGELAGLLRTLRRRHARQRRDSELSYRELAARTGWSHTAIAEYFTGKTLPPIDRFDILIGLLGATPGEQGALATARDRVAEHHRRIPRRTGGRTRKSAVRQLPADVAGFSGRAEHLALLDAFLAETPAAAIAAVSGMSGVGKTALAVHWAHRVADRFPDGQLYVNLRGLDPTGSPMSPGDAILQLLDALSVPPRWIQPDLDAKADLYRREIAGRRMLILLDDAHDLAQVRSLLPTTPGCLVLLTSRNPLSGLAAAHSVHPIALDVFTEREAREFLIGRLGAGRVRAEPDAVAEIIIRCARLPFALAIAASLAVTHPGLPLYVVAEQVRETGLGTSASAEDPAGDVRAVFSTSY